MIEVTSYLMKCARFYLDYSQMPAVALHMQTEDELIHMNR